MRRRWRCGMVSFVPRAVPSYSHKTVGGVGEEERTDDRPMFPSVSDHESLRSGVLDPKGVTKFYQVKSTSESATSEGNCTH